jgi:hypothetical protein
MNDGFNLDIDQGLGYQMIIEKEEVKEPSI